LFPIKIDVVIGFNPDQYIVDESDGSVNFTVAILSGELAFDVVVEFFTEDGNAEGKRFMLYGIAKKIMACPLFHSPRRLHSISDIPDLWTEQNITGSVRVSDKQCLAGNS
jgi:hypothetical protein